jgi:hypothetical protein
VDQPLDLPDGTELTIPIPERAMTLGVRDDDWSETPEAVEAWIRWYDSLEALDFTPAERAAWEAARQEEKQYEFAQWDKRSRQIEEQFP